MGKAFSGNPEAVALKLTLPAGQTDLSAQVLRARRAGATALLVWGQPPTIAAVLTASRSIGWQVPVYTPPTGSDPFIRQQLADHPEWVDGLTFAGGRLTAEVGSGPFVNFQSQYEATYGADQVGVKNSQGQPVVEPPEFAMYSYDFIHVLVAAIAHASSVDPAQDHLRARTRSRPRARTATSAASTSTTTRASSTTTSTSRASTT